VAGLLRLVLASRNKGKLKELTSLLEGRGFSVVPLDFFLGLPEIEETGATFKENAVLKARETARMTGCLSLADDSGLEVDFLNGAPGVYSSRFAGPGKDDEANNRKLLSLLEGVPEPRRTARFRCVVAVAAPGGFVETAEGICEGRIGFKPQGINGFGYDPIFIVEGYGCTMAQLDASVKNRISHRAKAFFAAVKVLETFREEFKPSSECSIGVGESSE